jgi:hypothetical protein
LDKEIQMADRTSKGNVTASAREKYGMGGKGKFPVFDHTSAMSAVSLRGHGDTDPAAVLAKVSKYANEHNDAQAKAAVAKAREKDADK